MEEVNMKQIESRGVTIDAAISAGLEKLGLSRDQVDITIIDEGSRGLLGIGSREAVVRLSPVQAEKVAPVTPSKKPLDIESVPDVEGERAESHFVMKPSKPPQAHALKEPDDFDASEAGQFPTAGELQTERDAAIEIITELLEKMHVPAGVTGYLSEVDDVTGHQVNMIDVTGEDLAVLIGPRGETLESLQFLSRLMVSHRLQRRVNFVVDVEGYRQRRVQALTRLAERMADKVRQRQEPISLEPMTSYERRIIHMALRDAPDVYTESAGEGKGRKVRIYPK